MKRLTFIGDINVFTGYGQHAIQIIRGLKKVAGVHLAIRPLSVSTQYEDIPIDIAERIVSCIQPEPWEILLRTPNFGPTPGKRTAYVTMNESTRISDASKTFLNSATVVIVPSRWNAVSFSACGVNAPIRMVPLGVDPELFHYCPFPNEINDLCVFGSAGRTANGRDRKGIIDSIEAFLTALPFEEDARLNVKVFPDCDVPEVSDPRVKIVRSYLSEEKMADWFAGIHCFLSAAKGEGWGLMQHQAMAIGRPIISVCFGGVAELFDEQSGYPVPFRMDPAKEAWKGLGHWAQPDRDGLISQIRNVYAHRRQAMERGFAACQKVRDLTWDNSNRKLAEVLEEFGAIEYGTVHRYFTGRRSFNYGVIAYLPPRGIGHTEIFLKNIEEYPPVSQMVFLSDGDWRESVKIPSPTQWFKHSNQIAGYVFLKALEEAEARGWDRFVYLETDCRVKGGAWDAILSEKLDPKSQIAAGHMAICNPKAFPSLPGYPISKQIPFDEVPGTILCQGDPDGKPVVFVNGAPAVYSVAALRKLFPPTEPAHIAVYNRFPIQDRSLGELAFDEMGRDGAMSKFVHVPQILATAGETIHLLPTRIEALEKGTVNAIHPIKNRWRPAPEEGYSFYHSGDMGDIIYGLKAIALMGGGNLVLGPEYKWLYQPRATITREVFGLFESLLGWQPYLENITFSAKMPKVSYDLNEFRTFWMERKKLKIDIENLAEIQCYTVGIEGFFDGTPWMIAPEKRISPIIIHRSSRYQFDRFPWRSILSKFKDVCFVGLPEEHQKFVDQFGRVPFYQVKDFMDMASVINGADWFIGNQSFPCSLAIAMGKRVYQETFPESPDCVFSGPGFYNQETPIEEIRWM